MSYTEVEHLRKSGNLQDAYVMAVSDLKEAFDTEPLPAVVEITDEEQEADHFDTESMLALGKRALAWVLYDYLKRNTDAENIDNFLKYLKEFTEIDLDPREKMVVNQLVWLIGKSVFEFTKEPDFDISKVEELFLLTKQLHFSKQTKGYSFLFKGFHKALKESPMYLDFVQWWDLHSFIRDDYKYTKHESGLKIMAVAEQGCNRYAKQLLRALDEATDKETSDRIIEMMRSFLLIVDEILHYNKYYKKLPHYRVKLLMALEEYQIVFYTLRNHARMKHDEFWVWEMLSDAYFDETEKQIACLSTALLCRTKADKLVLAREKLAGLLINEGYYNEAKTEIGQILRICLENKWDIPESVTEWGERPWYGLAKVKNDNIGMYESYRPVADEIIYGDVPQRKIVVETVNFQKKILNFIGLDFEKGYFKFDKLIKKVNEGDVLLVRLKELGSEGRYEALHLVKTKDKSVEGILQQFTGIVTIPVSKPFGFVDGMFIIPDLCSKHELETGDRISGVAMISYNKKKEEWGWKVISID